MKKILLAAVNACYYHTNLAVRSIKEYCKNPQIEIGEWTINQTIGEILRGICKENPDLIIFSTYIWNAEIIKKLICEIKSILPECMIGAGGPEFGYCAQKYLSELESLDFIIFGEGEKTVKEVCEKFDLFGDFETLKSLNDIEKNPAKIMEFSEIKGIYYRDGEKVNFSGERELLPDLSELSFPYPVIDEPDNKIFYYESSRGCPFSCAYCMSSLDKRVRFMPVERVFEDLQRFLDAKVKLVKFVDRTYNLNEERYLAIWNYILLHHNGKTMFHFELEAEFLSEKALDFLQKVPEGVMQFEIGVQSANKKTLESVCRSQGIEKLAENIKKIPKTINCHLDLIAGLPFENLESFGKSFDFVMALFPTELQLGFLKVLHGTKMEKYSEENDWKWMKNPPYETFSTPYMSWNDIIFLKDLEILLNEYWNSHLFEKTMRFVERNLGFWTFFSNFTLFAREKGAFDSPKKGVFWFNFLAENLCFFEKYLDDDKKNALYELLRFDFIKQGKKGGFPDWYKHNYDKNLHRLLLQEKGGIGNSRLDFAYSDVEEFSVNPLVDEPEKTCGKFNFLFLYTPKGSVQKREYQILMDNLQNGEKWSEK